MNLSKLLFCTILARIVSCKDDDLDSALSGCSNEGLLEEFTIPYGQHIFIYEGGRACNGASNY